MNTVKLLAHAKINLTLDVTGKRPDGYHTLVTVMQSISLADRIELEITDSGSVTLECNDPAVPSDGKNIACKAAEAFCLYTKSCLAGLHIKIVKKTPLQAGLGGGSADCAAVLTGLNRMLGTDLSDEALCQIGARLGADVPFCIVGGTRLCGGIGDIMSPAPPLEDCFIVIGKGSEGVSTKEAYGEIDSRRLFCTRSGADGYNGSILSLKNAGGNVFEETVSCGDVKRIKDILYCSGAEYSAMSGSGSAVFGLFREKAAAESSCKALKRCGFFSEICSPLTNGVSFIDL